MLAVHSNVVVRLAPGLVARVGGLTAEVRDVRAVFEREVAVGRVLARAGAPAVRPTEPAGPHAEGDHVLTLWEEVPPGPPPAGDQVGPALRACHEALRADPPAAELPSVSSLLDEARSLVDRSGLSRADRLLLRGHLARAGAEVASAGLPRQPLHGDAGPGNVLPGPVWNDWEDSCAGPVAWDLASMVTTPRVLGIDRDRAEAGLAAYGPFAGAGALDVFIHARAAQSAAWSAFAVHRADADPERLAGRLAWLRAN